jgi:hypothetical protein
MHGRQYHAKYHEHCRALLAPHRQLDALSQKKHIAAPTGAENTDQGLGKPLRI